MRPDRGRAPLWQALFLLATLALIPDRVSAQTTEADAWYRVEILIFRQPGDAGLTAEAWNPLPELTYPERHRHLIDPALADARLQAFPGSQSQVGADGRQRLRLPAPRQGDVPVLADPAASAPLGEDIPAVMPVQPTVADTVTGPTDTPVSLPLDPARADAKLDVDDPEVPLPPPAAFTVLPERFRELSRDAARMRSAGYVILRHDTWVQPIADEKTSRAIILDRSGDPDSDGWPVLQGSITLHLSRYLHAAAKLWLNTDGNYLHSQQWRMPNPPLSPPSLVLSLPALDDWYARRTDSPGTPDARRGLAEAPLQDTVDDRRRTAEGRDPRSDALNPFPYRHAIVLDQSRRMRGGELHYLDHPVLGVLIKVTRLDNAAWREAYKATHDWAWEDRHNVTIREGTGLKRP